MHLHHKCHHSATNTSSATSISYLHSKQLNHSVHLVPVTSVNYMTTSPNCPYTPPNKGACYAHFHSCSSPGPSLYLDFNALSLTNIISKYLCTPLQTTDIATTAALTLSPPPSVWCPVYFHPPFQSFQLIAVPHLVLSPDASADYEFGCICLLACPCMEYHDLWIDLQTIWVWVWACPLALLFIHSHGDALLPLHNSGSLNMVKVWFSTTTNMTIMVYEYYYLKEKLDSGSYNMDLTPFDQKSLIVIKARYFGPFTYSPTRSSQSSFHLPTTWPPSYTMNTKFFLSFTTFLTYLELFHSG